MGAQIRDVHNPDAVSTEVPTISVVVSTRNRGAAVVTTIESILASRDAAFELIVVDQSDDDTTANSVLPYLDSHGIHFIRTSTRGLSAARNIGISSAHNEWIALTDDDCTVGPNWLLELYRAFQVDPQIGVVFGNVLPGEHDRDAVFIPSYVRSGSYLARSLADKHNVEGIGACMALRKSVWAQLRGFDPLLGAGSNFHAAEELDFEIRALEAGHGVYETDRVEVVHWGGRDVSQKSALAYTYCVGIGAAYGKHLKCGRWRVLLPLVKLACRWAFSKPRVSYGEPPERKSRLRGFLDGILGGIRTPVNRQEVLYNSPGQGDANGAAKIAHLE